MDCGDCANDNGDGIKYYQLHWASSFDFLIDYD